MKIKLSESFKKDLAKFLELLTIGIILSVGFVSILFIGYIAQVINSSSFSIVSDLACFGDLFLFVNFNKLLMTLLVGIIVVVIATATIYSLVTVLYYIFQLFKNIFLYLKENIIVHEEEKLQN